jgi:hypothetical protein
VNGKQYLKGVAKSLEDSGWSAPDDFNVVEYTRATVAELFLLLERSSAQTVVGTRVNKRLARKCLHAIKNALRDVEADPDEVNAAAEAGLEANEDPDAEALGLVVMEALERRRAEMALAASRLPTATRGPKVVLALERAIESVERAGVTPVGRAREPVAAPAPPPRRPRDVRGEPAGEEEADERTESLQLSSPMTSDYDEEYGEDAGSGASDAEAGSSRDNDVEDLPEEEEDDEDIEETPTSEPLSSPRTTGTPPPRRPRARPARATPDRGSPLIGGLPDDGWG